MYAVPYHQGKSSRLTSTLFSRSVPITLSLSSTLTKLSSVVRSKEWKITPCETPPSYAWNKQYRCFGFMGHDHLQQATGAFDVPSDSGPRRRVGPLVPPPTACSFLGSFFAMARKISLTFAAVLADVSRNRSPFS